MSNLNFKNRIFFHPKTKEPILFDENEKKFFYKKDLFFDNFENIPDLFIDDKNENYTNLDVSFYEKLINKDIKL